MSASAEPVREQGIWRRRAVRVALVLAVLILLGFLGAAFLPRWWSHRIGGQVDGSMSVGIILGLFYGFVFTLLPLLLLRWAFRTRHRSWKAWATYAITTIVLASPNLLTLGVVLGSGRGAHAGQRTLDVDAPGFRASTLAGAIAAAVVFATAGYLLITHRRSGRRLARAKAEAKAQSQAQSQK